MPRKLRGKQVTVTGRELYKAEHGVYPRGRGGWSFKIGDEIHICKFNQSYTEAKIDAQEKAAYRGISTIRVLP